MGNPDFLKMGRKGPKGRAALEAHLKKKKLSRRRAAQAKCYECMGGYAGAPADCNTPRCPLYLYMPYRCSQQPFRLPNYKEVGKLARGKKEFIAHMQGVQLKLFQAVPAKCYDCMGGYVDGRSDCKISGCPLYPFMPYQGVEEKIEE